MRKLKFLLYIAGAVALAVIITQFVAQRTRVDGLSMYPTLNNGDQLIVEKLSYHVTAPSRYDIVIFKPDKDRVYIKRVIGLPGETIQIHDGYVYINGKKLKKFNKADEGGIAKTPLKLKDDEYFCMGDNRPASEDSRYIGPVKEKQIKGHAVCRIWPWRDKKKL